MKKVYPSFDDKNPEKTWNSDCVWWYALRDN